MSRLSGSRALPVLAGWNAGSWILLAAYQFGLTAIVYRTVGSLDYGVWATVVALRTMLLLVEGGLSFGVTRDAARAARSPAAGSRVYAARRVFFIIGAIVAVTGLVGAILPGMLLGLSGDAASAAAGVTMLFGVEAALVLWGSPYGAQLKGLQRFDLVATSSAVHVSVGIPAALIGASAFGIVGAAMGAVAARMASFAVLRLAAARNGLPSGQVVSRASRPRHVLTLAAPMWIVAAAGQISIGTDVPIVGALHGPQAAGHYALGALLPAAAIGLLYVMVDVAFPRLASAAHDAPRLALRLVFAGCALAAVGFATLALHADAFLLSWVGDAPELSRTVLTIYAIAWLLNVPTHVLILLGIARRKHAVFARIAVGEAIASLVLGVILAIAIGPIGPAIGTLAAVAISNHLVTPALVLGRLSVGWTDLIRATLGGYALGFAAAVPIAVIVSVVALPPPARVLLVVACLLVAGAAGYAVSRVLAARRSASHRIGQY